MRNTYNVLVGSLKVLDHLGDTDIDGIRVLKCYHKAGGCEEVK
jgi:hypothetical protein